MAPESCARVAKNPRVLRSLAAGRAQAREATIRFGTSITASRVGKARRAPAAVAIAAVGPQFFRILAAGFAQQAPASVMIV